MILKESELGDQKLIQSILGKPYKQPGKILTATGSSYFFVKEITDLDGNPLPLKREEMKAIFQRYEKGLYLHFNKSNYQNAILVKEESLEQITLSRFQAERDKPNQTVLNTIFSLLPRFITSPFKYSTRETHLEIKTDLFRAKMITSYSSFSSLINYFSALNLKDKFVIEY